MINATILGVSTVGVQVFVQYRLSAGKDGQISVAMNSSPSDINALIAAIVDAANYAESLRPLINTTVVTTTPPPPPTKQTPQFVADAVSLGIGATVTLSVNLVNGMNTIAGFQFDVVLPPLLTLAGATIGQSSSDAGKQLTIAGNRLIVIGLNQTTIADGEVVILSVAADKTLLSGNYPMTFINGFSTDPLGTGISALYIGNTIKVT